ncbi:hypothetical protein BDZ94DRAFT_1277496, partial [Collybia nuda]
MPDFHYLTPAWNPSSQTPDIGTSSQVYVPPTMSQQQGPSHPLLDPQLINIKLKVLVTGGQYQGKEMVVSLVKVDGELSIQFNHYKTLGFLLPGDLTLKRPNPTR